MTLILVLLNCMSSFEIESSYIILILPLFAILLVWNYTEQQKPSMVLKDFWKITIIKLLSLPYFWGIHHETPPVRVNG